MLAKPLLRTAASWIAIAAFAACATTNDTSSGPPATVEGAQQYLAAAEEELTARYEREARIAWVYSTYINYDTEWLLQRADAEGTEARVRLASGAARYADLDLPADTQRQLDRLRLSITLPAPQRAGAADELAAITTRLASRYSTGRVTINGEEVTLDDMEQVRGR
jgi:peptidyl-dipeptidase A